MQELGYVHADIRLNNIVFTLEGRSHLIDFDLAIPVGQHKYPKGYAFLRERHRDAKEGNIVKKEHDIYSMRKVILIVLNAMRLKAARLLMKCYVLSAIRETECLTQALTTQTVIHVW